jgi:Leucine-rich repeat (LRR) protein
LNGSVPASLGNLTELEYLYLYDNSLSGTIPPALGNLINLKNLRLHRNKLCGTVPRSFGNLVNLQGLYLGSNELYGTIPSELGNLTVLTYCDLSRNRLNGSIPSSLGNLLKLNYLYLSTNDLYGTIPDSLGNLRNLLTLDVSYNKLSGTIPSELGSLLRMTVLSLTYNRLNGSIPSSFGNLIKLRILSLDYNDLYGTVLSELGNLKGLLLLDLSYNHLNGSIPSTIGELCSLEDLWLGSNKLTGTIPSNIFDCGELDFFQLAYNRLNGSLPETMNQMYIPSDISLGSNQFTGTIPDYFQTAHCTNLKDFSLFGNYFHGTIPSSFSSCTSLQYLQLSNDRFSGKILENGAFFNFSILRFFNLDSNQFSGTISSNISNLHSLEWMNISFNSFYGEFPRSISNITPLQSVAASSNKLTGAVGNIFSYAQNLTFLYLDNNHFTGPVEELVNASFQQLIIDIDISYNSFTGAIPGQMFTLPFFASFIAAVNCISADIPAQVCHAMSLRTLVLDGLQSANDCFSTNTFHTMFGSSYTVKTSLPIPSCLFSLPSLRTLHLSGNGYTGSLPGGMTLADNLTDLALSYNALTGSIPGHVFTKRNWDNLDLSFNYFNGILPSDAVTFADNASLSLEINRLSGKIPSSYQNTRNISILNGNMFDCNSYDYQTDLPKHDSAFNSYDCGSDSINDSIVYWAGLIFLISLTVLFHHYMDQLRYFQLWLTLSNWWACAAYQRDWNHLSDLMKALSILRLGLLLIFLYLIIVMMPIYSTLAVYCCSYTTQYIWTVSSAFLSGVTPAAIVLLFLVIFLIFCFYLAHKFSMLLQIPTHRNQRISVLWNNKTIWIIFLVIIMIDVVVVMVANGSYVYAIYQSLSRSNMLLVSISLALFKFSWGSLVLVPLFGKYVVSNLLDKLEVPITEEIANQIEVSVLNILISLSIFNNVIVPYIASAFISPNCFLYFFTSPPTVSTSYDSYISVVSNVIISGQGVVILAPRLVTNSISYTPPYIYSYSCNSSLLTGFVHVFIYRYIFSGIIRPLACLLILWVHKHYQGTLRNSKCYFYVDWMMMLLVPKTWKIEPAEAVTSQSKGIQKSPGNDHEQGMPQIVTNNAEEEERSEIDDLRRLALNSFIKKRFLVNLIGDLSIAFTFGVIFPPLFLIIFFAVLIELLSLQLSVGRLLHLFHAGSSSLKCILLLLNQEFANFSQSLIKYMFWILQVSVFFWALSLFDTLGDEVGAVAAIWIVVLLCCCPWILFGFLYSVKRAQQFRQIRLESVNTGIESVAFSTANPILSEK